MALQEPNALSLLQIPQTPLENPLETAQKVQALQVGQQNYQLNAMKLQQQRQDFQDEQDIRAAAQQSGGDLNKISQVLNSRNPRAGAKFDQELAATRKSKAEADELALKNRTGTLDLMGRDASAVQDQAGWTRLINNPTYKDHTQGLNPQYDPVLRDQLVQSTMSAKDQAEAHQRALTYNIEKQKANAEASKEQRETDAFKQAQRDRDFKMSAEVMSQVKDQPSHDAALQYLKSQGVSPDVINLYGSQYTPDTPNKAKGYLTAGQQLPESDKNYQDWVTSQYSKKYPKNRAGYEQWKMDASRQEKIAAAQASRQQPEVPGLEDITETTSQGRKYVPTANLTQKQKEVINTQAAAAGIPVVDKDTAEMLRDLDTARSNQKFMLDKIESKLPKDAMGRVIVGPVNKGKAISQLDPELAATGTFRNAAIQSMRALAGSRGLRINRAEIEMAMQNDIPQASDTVETARQKLQNIQTLLDNTEKAHLTRNRATSAEPSSNGRPPLSSFEH